MVKIKLAQNRVLCFALNYKIVCNFPFFDKNNFASRRHNFLNDINTVTIKHDDNVKKTLKIDKGQ